MPANALWLTNIVVSLFVISTYWSRDAFNFMLDMTSVTSLLPYLLVAGYGVLLARAAKATRRRRQERGRDQIFAWIAVIYTLFMFVAAGLKVRAPRSPCSLCRAPSSMSGRGASRTPACSPGSNSSSSASRWSRAAIGVVGLVTGPITP